MASTSSRKHRRVLSGNYSNGFFWRVTTGGPIPHDLSVQSTYHHRHRRRHHAKQFHHSRFPDTSLARSRYLSTDDRPHARSCQSSHHRFAHSSKPNQHGWHRRSARSTSASASVVPGFRQLDPRPSSGFFAAPTNIEGFGAGSMCRAFRTSAAIRASLTPAAGGIRACRRAAVGSGEPTDAHLGRLA